MLPHILQKKIRMEHKPQRSSKGRRKKAGTLRIVTYNVHRCRGLDRRVLPLRICEIIRELDPDIVAVQEVLSADNGRRQEDQPRYIAEELDFSYVFGENRRLNGDGYGNAVLTRLPIGFSENFSLSVEGREERGCLRADIALSKDVILHLYNVHLGTAYHERHRQGRRLVQSNILTREDVVGPRIVLGDFNEWLPGAASRLLADHFGCADIRHHMGRRCTYPGIVPFLHLDHMYFDDWLTLEHAWLHRTGKAIIASDHLPLVADFRLRDGPIQ
jgi:endonuclease/exonuclease/phosphatase family metal-dependent hydrolase